LRNALTEIITEIIKQVLTQREANDDDLDTQDAHKKAKIRLLDKLVRRVNDKHAYCRSHVLKAFVDLCNSNVVPKQYLRVMLLKGCERIKDISANVRKKALELVDKVIRMYYSIFVGNSDSGFITVPELQRQSKFNAEEEKDLEKQIRKLNDKLKEHDDDSEEYSEIQSEMRTFQQKLETVKAGQENITEYINMLNAIEKIVPNLLQLLGSKNSGDVTETIRLFVTLKLFKIKEADNGIKKMLVLIWSKEKLVLEELLKAYWKLYFDAKAFSSEQIAWNLINLYTAGNLTERTSFEEMLLTVLDTAGDEKEQKLRENFTFHAPVFKFLWNIFLDGFKSMEKDKMEDESENPSRKKESTRNALTLLRIANFRRKDILESRFDSFNVILHSFLKNNNPDWIFVKEISLMVEKSKESSPRVNQMIKSMLMLVLKWHGTVNSEWYCATEQIINMIFSLKQNPEALVQYLILQCSKFLVEPESNSKNASQNTSVLSPMPDSPVHGVTRSGAPVNTQMLGDELNKLQNLSNDQMAQNFEEKFSQLIFIVGHVSVKFLLHFDVIEQHFKKLKNEAETKMQADQKDDTTDKELEKISGGMEADFENKITTLQNISESCIVFKNLLSVYVPYIKQIVNEMVKKEASTRNPLVERVVVLTLCKYMCTSHDFCQDNLKSLFALLKAKIDPITKTNIIIALGDLIHRFPNMTEPHTHKLYENLQDDDVNVRKTTLLVITHLILNDMLKLKAEISDIALLFEDPDQKIQNLVKLFFHELHKKDSKIIYNLLPECIGRLSRMKDVDEGVFQNFAKNIMPYLEKEKYSESLVEKLCARFKNPEPKEWRNSAYCLHLLSYNEKGLRKLVDYFEYYREKLADEFINECFRSVLSKMKKFNKPEVKTLLEEWESKINNYTKEDGDVRKRKVPENKKKAAAAKKRGGRGTQDMDVEDEEINENSRGSKGQVTSTRQTRHAGTRNKQIVYDDASDDDKQGANDIEYEES